jgi:hypothetical protein
MKTCAFLVLVGLFSCSDRATTAPDAQTLKNDGNKLPQDTSIRTEKIVSQDDFSHTSDGNRVDAFKADAQKPDALVPVIGEYLLWGAPGGFAGTGPALEVLSDGTVHLWEQASQPQPHKTSGWKTTVQLTPSETKAFFALLAAVNFSNLPHSGGPNFECYPFFYYEPCAKCAAKKVSYDNAGNLKPEMDAVYAWLDKRLQSTTISLPSTYCLWY